MNGVILPVITQYDGKGFKQAEKGLNHLTKSTAKFLGSLALAHKAQKAMLSYIADEKATKVLAQNLKNLGLAYAIPSAEEFIKTMQKQTGILDDELRPAYSQLARVTGSTLETQRLMNTAFNVAAGTGQDYGSVIDALSKAYVGNNKGLRSLNIGLTDAELKSKSFADIVNILNTQFRGSGDASLESYAGKMALLQVAASDASEAIGKSLLDAITTIQGQGGFPKFINGIKTSVQWIDDLVTATARLVATLGLLASAQTIGQKWNQWRQMQARWNKEDLQVEKERLGIANNYSSYFTKQAAANRASAKFSTLTAKADAERLATLKKTTAEKAAQAALDKANATLNAANNVFDIERIGVAAALANQTLTDNERKRLEIKQSIFALEDAIDSKDTTRITKQTDILNGLLGQFAAMQKQAALLDSIKTAFDALGVNKDLINLKNLQEALDLLTKMSKIVINPITGGSTNGTKGATSGTILGATGGIVGGTQGAGTGSTQVPFGTILPPPPDANVFTTVPGGMSNPNLYGPGKIPSAAVTVNIAGDLQKLIDSITFETQNASANGTPVALNRNATNLAW